MKKILITEFMDEESIDFLRRSFNVYYNPELFEKPSELLKIIEDAAALIVRNKTMVTSEIISKAPLLEAVGRLGVGLDNLDVAACNKENVTVYPAHGANARSVAEYVIAAALILQRNILPASFDTKNGLWNRSLYLNGHECEKRIFGILGFGHTGSLTGKLAGFLGWKVIASSQTSKSVNNNIKKDDFNVEFVSFEKLLSVSDIISIHLPLTEETRDLIGEKELRMIKKGSILINTARGGIVDENALAFLLNQKYLGGAAIDVFSEEPLKKSPLYYSPNTILTPHIAGITSESNVRVSRIVADKIALHLGADRK